MDGKGRPLYLDNLRVVLFRLLAPVRAVL